MKKALSFVLSIALLGNLLCSTVALAETDSNVGKQTIRSSSIIINHTIDPDSIPEI